VRCAGDGTIDKEEFEQLLMLAGGGNLSAEARRRLFAAADKDGDGELDLNEIRTLGAVKREKAKNF
jgi:Ca2+-binding EF-hand superfamily protein